MKLTSRDGLDAIDRVFPTPLLSDKPAVRLEQIMDLYAPWTEHEDGTVQRDPRHGIISQEEAQRLLDLPAKDE